MTVLQKPTFQSTWLPLGLGVLALVILNLGLYQRLASQQVEVAPTFDFPYFEDFSSTDDVIYEEFGGDWEIRDQMLVQMSTSGFDLMSFVPIEIMPEQPYRFDTTLRFLGGTMGGGLIFNAQQTTSRQQSHMTRFNVDAGQLWLIYGYFGDDSDFVGQGSVGLGISPDDTAPHTLSVAVANDTYTLLVDGNPVAAGIPLLYQGGAVGFISATSQVAFDDIRVEESSGTPTIVDAGNTVVEAPPQDVQQPVSVPQISTTPLFVDSFDVVGGTGNSLWQPISGNWIFADGAMIQQQTDGFDLSTIYQQPIPYPMNIGASFEHRSGAGGGLLFNLPSPTTKNGGHMVRYVDDGSVIAWGYFDESGAFNGQGSTAVNLPGTDRHWLTVYSDGQTYAVYLDESELVSGIPVNNPVETGYIGLTASQSIVAFDEISVSTANTVASPTEEVTQAGPANINAEAASGNWLVEGNLVTQVDTELTDYIAGTGLAGERFTISVDITLPTDNPESGAGILFHMDGRDDPALGYMVRFGNGGQELFWGSYDSEGVFAGEGGIPQELTLGEAHNLLLIVRETNFDIQVNGETVVEAIPIQRSSGWIGLVSFSGPVTFSNVNLQLGE